MKMIVRDHDLQIAIPEQHTKQKPNNRRLFQQDFGGSCDCGRQLFHNFNCFMVHGVP